LKGAVVEPLLEGGAVEPARTAAKENGGQKGQAWPRLHGDLQGSRIRARYIEYVAVGIPAWRAGVEAV